MTTIETAKIDYEEQVMELRSLLDRTNTKLHNLATMGAIITSIRDFETILSVVMEMSIRTVEAEVGLLQLADKDELSAKICWGIDDSMMKNLIYKDGQNISDYCFNKQEKLVLCKGDDDFNFGPNISCLIAMPIKSRAKCHGVIVVINKANEGNFDSDDIENFEVLVNFAAVAIDNSILLKESLLKQKLEQELAIAKQIQEAILPETEIAVEGIDIGTIYRPARYVGGDFYDLIMLDDKQFLLAIGDVSNKGVPAAIVMSAATAIIRAELMRSPGINPSQLMSNLNQVLCNGVIKDNDMFATLFIALVNIRDKKVIYCNAGHNPPLYWHFNTGEISELNIGGPFVGQFPEIEYSEGSCDINEGDRFLAYTDGVTESEDINKGQFGVERLMQAIVNHDKLPAGEFCDKLIEWLDHFTEGASEEPFDDITLFNMVFDRL
jgi:sigma-B regulation protein RsbU (phosphoserine phosphatase)